MASTSAELIVAKAALTGALFRADPQSCSRDEIESTLTLLNTATAECSPSNVQKCKQWALTNLVPSSMRIAPFCKYLIALVKSYGQGQAKDLTESEKKRGRETSVKRKRLHALYLLNDILYHVKFRNHDDSFAPKLEQALLVLVSSASSFTNCPKHIGKIQDLISLWEEKGYFSEAVVKQLRVAVEDGPSSNASVQNTAQPTATSTSSMLKPVRAAPYIMPAMHGDPSMPWYDLPAGNWMPVLEPNSTRPMNPDMIKPLVLPAGPADKTLVQAVQKLLVDVDNIFSKDAANLDGPTPEIGQMGEVIEIDEITGEVIGGETYYGWSRNFCEKMKKRNQRGASGNDSRSRTRERTRSSRSRSRSRSRSYSPSRSRDSSRGSDARPAFKRQRLSESPERRHRSRSRSRSQSRSRSRSRDRSRDRSARSRGYDSRSRSRSRSRGRYRSRSRSRSTSRPGFRQRSPRYGSRGRSRSESSARLRGGQHQQPPYHAPPPLTGFPTGVPPRPPQHPGVFVPPPPPPHNQPVGNFHPVPPPIGFPVAAAPLPGQPHQFASFPVPPPPPPPQNYQGQWPPPPPGPPHQYPQHPQHPTPPPHITPSPPPNFFPPGGPMAVPPHPPPFAPSSGGAWPPPPPPPHSNQAPHHAQHQQHQQHQPQYHQSQQHQGRDYQGYSQHQPRDYQQHQQQQGRKGDYGGGNGPGYRGGRGGGGAGRGDYGRGGYGGQRGGAPWGDGWT
ncbi:hypothetical protein B0T13DRAFT_463656 [Neurospora crassa]|nr:hypothetical protein B0T13DRAFT_463656 [Neurospora crassa]